MAEQGNARLHATVDGRVQGVGFRAFVVDMAQILDLTGWVRNMGDGKVEMLAEGPREKLEQMLEYLRRGPRGAWVSGVEQEWQEATGEFNHFAVVRSGW